MSAPVLNAASVPATPPVGVSAGGSASAAGTSAAAGFEALLGVFFGGQNGLAAELFAGAKPAGKAGVPGQAADKGADDNAGADVSAEAQGLAAAFLAAPLIAPATATTETMGEATAAPVTTADVAQPATATVPGDAKAAEGALAAALAGQKNAKPATAGPPAPPAPPVSPTLDAQPPASTAQAAAAAALAASPPGATPPAPPAASAAAAAPQAQAAQHSVAAQSQKAGDAPVSATPAVPATAPHAAVAAASGSSANDGANLSNGRNSNSGEPIGVAAKADGGDHHAQAPPLQPPPPGIATPLTHAATALKPPAETTAHLAAQIARHVGDGSTHFDIELTPAGLGRVDVRVEISAQGQLTAAMSFDNPHAAAELRHRAGELTRALEQAGFDMSGGLSFDVAGDRGQPGQGAPQQRDDSGDAWRGRAFQAALDVAGETDAVAGGLLNLQRRSSTGVDIRI